MGPLPDREQLAHFRSATATRAPSDAKHRRDGLSHARSASGDYLRLFRRVFMDFLIRLRRRLPARERRRIARSRGVSLQAGRTRVGAARLGVRLIALLSSCESECYTNRTVSCQLRLYISHFCCYDSAVREHRMVQQREPGQPGDWTRPMRGVARIRQVGLLLLFAVFGQCQDESARLPRRGRPESIRWRSGH